MRPELVRLFPSTVRVVELSDPELGEPLYPEEQLAIAKAVEKRRLEFTLGRTAARRALRELGVAPGPLLSNRDRSVVWPPEAWGSITHAEGLCAAIAALRRDHAGIGLDAEVDGRVRRELWSHVATPREIAWLETSASEAEAAHRATLLFSAKEAFYKAQFCVSRAWVGLLDAELTFEDASQTFELTLRIDVEGCFARGQRFVGRWAASGEHVVTGLVLPPRT